MITIRLCGGLGNQLFQLALGYSLEANGNEILYDASGFDSDTTRRYCLGDLGFRLQLGRARGQVINEGSLRFKPEILDLKGDYILTGYWQSEKYFERVRTRILEEIFLPPFKIGKKSEEFASSILSKKDSSFLHVRRSDNTNPHNKSIFGLLDEQDYYKDAKQYMESVFLHIRRTDYTNQAKINYHGLLDDEYFKTARDYINQNVFKPHFFVFSDDIKWAKQNMIDKNITVVDCNPMSGYCDDNGVMHKGENGREVEDLYLMSLASHGIIANSSFSWWAAWLHPDQNNRVVIAPKNWFHPNNNKKLDATDIVPARWIRL